MSKPILKDPRIRRNEAVPEVYIVPKASGANALVVRDYADTEDMLVLTENREIHFKAPMIRQHPTITSRLQIIRKTEPYDGLHLELGWLYPTAIQSAPSSMIFQTRGSLSTDEITFRSFDGSAYVRCARLIGGYLEIEKGKLTGDLDMLGSRWILSDGISVIYFDDYESWLACHLSPASDKGQNLGSSIRRYKNIFFGENLIADSDTATDVETLKDSPPVTLRGAYWDGITSADRDARILHRMLSTTPTSELALQIAGTDHFRIGDTGIVTHKDLLPSADNALDVGASTLRFAEGYFVTLYTGDICLNKGWKIAEEEDGLYAFKDGKKYKIKLEEVQ